MQSGWKAVFKVCILILKTYEDKLLNMSFEMMLAQLMNLPVKFFLAEPIDIQEKYKGKERTPEVVKQIDADKLEVIRRFDSQLKLISMPKILLERLKKEFDDSHSLSSQFGKPNTFETKYD